MAIQYMFPISYRTTSVLDNFLVTTITSHYYGNISFLLGTNSCTIDKDHKVYLVS